jgi:UDP-N-acetylglucosamine transferase subunit ALG13
MAVSDTRPLIFVTVGTDHHTFDRLIDWIEGWLQTNLDARLVVQHGGAREIDGAECIAFLPQARFRELLGLAAAVVCSAGPGAIMESRAAGVRPIVVPRLERLDEVVDDHQVTFARFLAARDLVSIAEDPDALAAALDRVLEEPDAYEVTAAGESAPGIEGVATLIDELVWGAR